MTDDEVLACANCDTTDLRTVGTTDRDGGHYCQHCQQVVDAVRRERRHDGPPSRGLSGLLERMDADTLGATR